MLMDGGGRMDMTARGTIPQQPCVKQQPVDGAPDETRISVSFLQVDPSSPLLPSWYLLLGAIRLPL